MLFKVLITLLTILTACLLITIYVHNTLQVKFNELIKYRNLYLATQKLLHDLNNSLNKYFQILSCKAIRKNLSCKDMVYEVKHTLSKLFNEVELTYNKFLNLTIHYKIQQVKIYEVRDNTCLQLRVKVNIVNESTLSKSCLTCIPFRICSYLATIRCIIDKIEKLKLVFKVSSDKLNRSVIEKICRHKVVNLVKHCININEAKWVRFVVTCSTISNEEVRITIHLQPTTKLPSCNTVKVMSFKVPLTILIVKNSSIVG